MELKITEKGKDKLKVEVKGETHTFLNILREKAWQAGCDQASYIIEHPYLSNPVISIKAKNPMNVLVKSSKLISDDAKAFSEAFKRALGRQK